MDKSSLKKALLEAKEIETFATESAKKIIEKEFLPKIENTVKQTLMEMEEKEMKENSEVSLDSGSSVNVKVSNDGTITITADEKSEVPTMTSEPEVVDLSTTSVDEIPGSEEESVKSEEEVGEEEEEEELFEIVEDLKEDEQDIEKIKDVEEKINSLESKIDKILELVGGEKSEGEVEIVDDEETSTEETPAEEPAKEATPAEEPAKEAAPAEEPAKEAAPAEEPAKEEAPAEEPKSEEEASEEEEMVFEFDDVLDESKNKDLEEIKKMLKELAELEEEEEEEEMEEEIEFSEEELEEILKEYGDEHEMTVADALKSMDEEEMCEIEIDEDAEEEEEMEEGMGISLTNRQGQNLKPETPHKKVRTGLNESIKAQYESKIDELKKENESLKTALKEYKESFVAVRKQISEVQTFNAKLAYANKVFTKGGLTNEEKTRISEQFDVCKTAEEAKALYNKLIKEGVSSVKTSVDKIKLPKAAAPSNSKGTLYESEETKRMKKLAGII